MCDFCDKIYKSIDELKQEAKISWYEKNSLVRIGNKDIKLYVPCDDEYYSGILEDIEINYCPKCGRKLNEKYILFQRY